MVLLRSGQMVDICEFAEGCFSFVTNDANFHWSLIFPTGHVVRAYVTARVSTARRLDFKVRVASSSVEITP